MNSPQNHDPLTPEELTERNDDEIRTLQQIVYPDHPVYGNAELAQRFWAWWFRGMPWKQSRIFGVRAASCLAGVRPISFLPVTIDGRDELCGMLNATVTHPAYRRRGIFSRTLQTTLAAAEKEERIRFLISFPNDNSYPLHLKHPRISALSDLPLYLKVLNYSSIASKIPCLPQSVLKVLLSPLQHSRDTAYDNTIQVRQLNDFTENFDALWCRVRTMHAAWISRTRQYLRWRYVQSPLADYIILAADDTAGNSLEGYAVARMDQRFGLNLGLILDLVALPERISAAEALVKKTIDILKDRGADAIGCLMLHHHPFARVMRRAGMVPVPGILAPRKFHVTIAGLTGDNAFNARIAEPQNWYLTLGDTDNV